ncbi:MAG TPA: hypothetical protein VF058_04020 [Actinomycetota bacterium]
MGWEDLGGQLTSVAAVAAWGDGEVQVFAVHDDGEVWNRYWDGRRWHDWESLGGSFTGHPAAAARDASQIDVFAVGADGVLRHRWWDGVRWVDWEEVEGAPHDGSAVSCAWVGHRLYLLVTGPDGRLWQTTL